MEPKTYSFNYSQDIIHLQTKYALFKRVANILFSVTFDEGFDEGRMLDALQLLIDRNDCLRLTFVKEGKEIRQYFEPARKLGKVPSVRFETTSQLEAWVRRFRRKGLDMTKGQTFKPVFAVNASGEQMVFIKISHYVADTYGIGVLVNDLSAIYEALSNGSELPPAPGSFEEVIRKDNEYRANTEATEKDRSFFEEYYGKTHAERPLYCGIHGDESDRWLKYKKKGDISLPYLFIRCDTKGYRFVIPAAITLRAEQWCKENEISMNTFFFYTYAIACSLRNNRAPIQAPLELMNCRATVADRKAAGTKVQSLSVCTKVDYEKSFNENIAALYAETTEMYRHTRLTYLEMEAMQHKVWNYSMLSQVINYCFSYIPIKNPKGVRLQVWSNGKGALVTYLAMMHDVDTNEVTVNYDIQTKMVTPEQLIEFQNLLTHVIEAVLDKPAAPLAEIF
jgi:hypothetical protein